MPTLGTTAQSLVDPWAIQQRLSTLDARYALNTMLMPIANQSYIDYRSGVMASGDTAGAGGDSSHMAMRVSSTGGMGVTVEMGNCVINTSGQGAYMCCLDAQKTLNLSSASSTYNRIDLVVARVYDDQNTAIGSTSGTRKFQVEVWKGDNSSGTPVAPSLTSLANAGVIPLAEVRVNKSITAITSSMITDRRGPGLVARGGMRGLYGKDATDATSAGHNASGYEGAYPGDQRWVHTNGFQHQIYYGKGSDAARSGWRGVHNALVYNANSVLGDEWHRGWQHRDTIASVTVPYPGTPYMVYPTGRVHTKVSPDVVVDFHIRHTSASGPVINWNTVSTSRDGTSMANNDTPSMVNIAPVMYGPFYEAKTFYLTSYNYHVDGANNLKGWAHPDTNQKKTLLSVLVYPSTVQPPNGTSNDGSGEDLIGSKDPGVVG